MKSISPVKALNKAYLKAKPNREDIELFKKNLKSLFGSIDEKESEEFHKNLVADLLKNTYYSPKHFINTKGKNDLVIHNDADAKSSVGVILEVKRPKNKSEMLKLDGLNNKAFHELLLYYLRERFTEKNLEIKQLIATNIYEWFIFDATFFERFFSQNKELVKAFQSFEESILVGGTTEFFYQNIAKPAIQKIISEAEADGGSTSAPFTYFDLRDYEKIVTNQSKEDDVKLVSLFKILSPAHLLKLPFANDSNTLDKGFYTELLHILGLKEIAISAKKVIARKDVADRNPGSIIENTVVRLDDQDKISRLDKPLRFGATNEEQLFNVALSLAITWINRILFLKLLEAQLISYNGGDTSFAFLNAQKIPDFDSLNDLFFSVLAKRMEERSAEMSANFPKVPYLNSSLFEPTDLEQATLFISGLNGNRLIPIFGATVLRDRSGKKRVGELNGLRYLFEFLDAYDFSGEGSTDIQEDRRTLINPSVLGLIFEKINGYKDGSFFTPGYITMYMARETIRRAVLKKFNRLKGWGCQSFVQLFDKIENKQEANDILNSLKICDPAVGSGHFLVSALNEIIAIKSELKILLDREGKTLRDYRCEVVNDELIITNDDGEIFEYNPKSRESQRVQEAIFHEKQTVIENCLFGVDINGNSVKICRLRLWIELLKSSYYRGDSEFSRLETLPNIDINIKSGDSLISRFKIDTDIGQSLKKGKWSIADYRRAVDTYRNAKSKEQKRDMESLISSIKSDFRTEIGSNDPKIISWKAKTDALRALEAQQSLFEENSAAKKLRAQKVAKLKVEIVRLDAQIEEIKNNRIFENAFEWRFEFPEVLNTAGNFDGFDVAIGNPPYGVSIKGNERDHLVTNVGKVPDFEIYYWFINRARDLLKEDGELSFIVPNTLLFNVFAQSYRLELCKNWDIEEVLDCTDFDIFVDATVRNIVLSVSKSNRSGVIHYRKTSDAKSFAELVARPQVTLEKSAIKSNNKNWGLLFKLPLEVIAVVHKMKETSVSLNSYFPETSQGIIAYDKYQGQDEETIKQRKFHHFSNPDGKFGRWLYGEDITKYSVGWNGREYIDYHAGIANPREPKYFTGKRILVREITNPSIFAALAEETFYNDPSVLIIKDCEGSPISIESVVGILNSKLATFYHFNSAPKATKGAFPKVLVSDLNEFPIPKVIASAAERTLKRLVRRISAIRAGSMSADTRAEAARIDTLVYHLYGLSYEESKLVDPLLGLSKADFDSMRLHFASDVERFEDLEAT